MSFSIIGLCDCKVLFLVHILSSAIFALFSFPQVSFLEKKVAELENEILLNGDVKSRLKQENTQLVHR